jgi:phosphoserine phosphatase
MSGETPGQAVYETGHRGYAVDEDWSPPPWENLTDAERADWEAAAKAGTVATWRLLDEARAALGKAREELDEMRATRDEYQAIAARRERERDQARELAAEILDQVEPRTEAGERLMAQWRQRAGLELAITTSGTEHLAEQLAERDA